MNASWPEQDVFCLRVKDYAQKNGLLTPRGRVDIERLAVAFGVATNSLKQFLQNKKRPRPHFDTLSNIAHLVGCPITDFMGGPTPDPTPTPRDEAFGNIMGFLGPNLSDQWKARLIELAQAAQEPSEPPKSGGKGRKGGK